MKVIIALVIVGLIASRVGQMIRMKKAGPDGVERVMREAVPKIMDRAFAKLPPERWSAMLGYCREILNGLEQKYGGSRQEAPETEGAPPA